jgi:hypothetical protein
LFGLAAEGGKAKEPLLSGKCVICAVVPQASKQNLAKQPLRDPSDTNNSEVAITRFIAKFAAPSPSSCFE